ncbi:MAG: GIY-YIG nuclease family protein [Candidatus Shapirobacteria bacterium]|nr:GIY-YIG nuclease family protein [Candidatus Shapirobacteria bacterium]
MHKSKFNSTFKNFSRSGGTGRPACRQAGAHNINMFYVYVLKSLKTGTFYKGLTNNIEKRIKQHEQGQCLSTKNILPITLIHVEICSSRLEARKMEKYLKSGYGREIIEELLERNLKT